MYRITNPDAVAANIFSHFGEFVLIEMKTVKNAAARQMIIFENIINQARFPIINSFLNLIVCYPCKNDLTKLKTSIGDIGIFKCRIFANT